MFIEGDVSFGGLIDSMAQNSTEYENMFIKATVNRIVYAYLFDCFKRLKMIDVEQLSALMEHYLKESLYSIESITPMFPHLNGISNSIGDIDYRTKRQIAKEYEDFHSISSALRM